MDISKQIISEPPPNPRPFNADALTRALRIAGAAWQAINNLRPSRMAAGSGACAINVNRRLKLADGRVVVGQSTTAGNPRAFRWDSSTGIPTGSSPAPSAITRWRFQPGCSTPIRSIPRCRSTRHKAANPCIATTV